MKNTKNANKEIGNKIETSRLENFNEHEWVSFGYEVKNYTVCPYVIFAEGCEYKGVDRINEFENNVVDKYSGNRLVLSTYLESYFKLVRLLTNAVKKYSIYRITEAKTFGELFKREEVQNSIKNYLKENEGNHYYSKNLFWFNESQKEGAIFTYMEDEEDDYYDLMCVVVNGFNFALPVPVLNEILNLPYPQASQQAYIRNMVEKYEDCEILQREDDKFI